MCTLVKGRKGRYGQKGKNQEWDMYEGKVEESAMVSGEQGCKLGRTENG